MRIKVNKERLEIAKKAQRNVLSNAKLYEELLNLAKHMNDAEAVIKLTVVCEELCLMAELLDAELTRLQSIYEVNLN